MNLTYPLILGSNSPRRKEILSACGFDFEVQSRSVDESYPNDLTGSEIPLWIANKKAEAFKELASLKIVICADTIVIRDGLVLGKPNDRIHAIDMLSNLSKGWHEVITAVCIIGPKYQSSFFETTQVEFRDLTITEIEYYVDNFNPFDKAGAYGIQEWIGSVAITEIRGSYLNVVGLPAAQVYEALKKFKV